MVSGGEIAGIVIGVVAGVALIITVIILTYKLNKRTKNDNNISTINHSNDIEKNISNHQQQQQPYNIEKSNYNNVYDNNDPQFRNSLQQSVQSTNIGGASTNPDEVQQNLLDSYKDTNQSQDAFIYPGSNVFVLYPYNAALPDELTIIPDQTIRVTRIYDDAWAAGQILGSSFREGAFPLVCVTVSEGAATSIHSSAPKAPSIRSSSVNSRQSSFRSAFQSPSEGGRASWVAGRPVSVGHIASRKPPSSKVSQQSNQQAN